MDVSEVISWGAIGGIMGGVLLILPLMMVNVPMVVCGGILGLVAVLSAALGALL